MADDQSPSAPHLSDVEARAGSRTRVTRNILVISLVLIIAILIAAVGLGYFETDQTGADEINAGHSGQATRL